jgi:uncharacterized repeat protein (TIGR03803 family)
MAKHIGKRIFGILCFCAVTAITSPSQTFTTLVMFDQFSQQPYYPSGVVQGANGDFYGTLEYTGLNAPGEVFEITPGGDLSGIVTICNFCTPAAGVVLGPDRNLYGTTLYGGNSNAGTLFKTTPGGELTTLESFGGTDDGANPNTALLLASDMVIYGTTSVGGVYGDGTVFSITSTGSFTTLHSFSGTDGADPSALVQATDGDFYGTTDSDGTHGGGTVFKITSDGTLTTLHNFCSRRKCADGSVPSALIQATDGNFYGTTFSGGVGGGTVFKITSTGKLTTLYTFCAPSNDCADGFYPSGGLIQGTDGNFYGVNSDGGDYVNICAANGHYGCGTVFSITPTGTLTNLHEFSLYADGLRPTQKITQGTNGNFYSTTDGYYDLSESMNDQGTVWSLSMGLGPFVSFVRGTAAVGEVVDILGQGFNRTSGVSFNGTPASFTVENDTYLIATVPVGATTGPVTVITPSGSLTSNVPFRVRP